MPDHKCSKSCQKRLNNKCLPCFTPATPEEVQEKQTSQESCKCLEKPVLSKEEALKPKKSNINEIPPNSVIDVKNCIKEEPPHPCDKPLPVCDPKKEEDECDKPFICLEKIKNPLIPGELKRCLEKPNFRVKSCVKPEPRHPCDPLPPCSSLTEAELTKKPPCQESTLCFHRIKNPALIKKDPACDKTK